MFRIITPVFNDKINQFFFFQDCLMIRKFCKTINVFTFSFDQFNASLLNKSINFLKNKKTKKHPTLLNGSVSRFPQKYWAAQLFSTLIIIRNVP